MPVRPTAVPSVPTSLLPVALADPGSPADGVAGLVGTAGAGPGPVEAVGRAIGPVSGVAGEVVAVGDPAGPRWLVGVGAGRPADWRTAGGTLVRELGAAGVRTLAVDLPADVDAARLGALVLGLRLGGYRFTVTREKPADSSPRAVSLRLARDRHAELAPALRRAQTLADATGLARDLANMPSNVKNPPWLADLAAELGAPLPGLTVTVRDEQWLAEHGFGGMLAVGAGSVTPPRLVELAWRPRGAKNARNMPHLALVGKGITFDTGGISLKPAENMHRMRTDMSGGGAVIAALRAIAELKLPVRVTGLVPLAENHLSGTAYRPGDIVRHYGGITTEVNNTDAEGRMVLADALAYAVRKHQPDAVVDVATLTGAMTVSLGRRTGGLFASTDELAARLADAGADVGEAWWRMPLLDAHAEDVRGALADLRQTAAGSPGGIFAALFLREFTGGLPWAHLDIAGPARAEEPYAEVTAGATGFAARTLVALTESFVAAD